MALMTLSGSLTDITSRSIESIASVTVKAPAPRVDGGSGVTITQPTTVPVLPSGEVTIQVVPGLGWLYLDGDGWSDSIRFVAAEGMTSLWEAVVNALPGSSMTSDYLAFIKRLKDEMRVFVSDLQTKAAFTIDPGTDWNTLTTDGKYYRASSTTDKNAPVTNAGTLVVTVPNRDSPTPGQLFMAHAGAGIYYRSGTNTHGVVTFSPWVRLDQAQEGVLVAPRQIEKGTDWDTVTALGAHWRGSTKEGEDPNAPIKNAGTLIVTGPENTPGQLFVAHAGLGVFYRSATSTYSVLTWSPWVRLDGEQSAQYGPAVAYGDSITWANGYQPIVRNMLNLASYINRGVSGRPMADGTANGVGTVTTVLSNSDHADFDLVTIAAGTNDFKLNVPLGEPGARGDREFDRETFYGAYRTTLDYILQQNVHARIVLFTPLKRNNGGYTDETVNTVGHSLDDYRQAIIRLGEMYALPVIDLFATSGFNKWTLSTYTRDGLHPNEVGYDRMARSIAGQLKPVMALAPARK